LRGVGGFGPHHPPGHLIGKKKNVPTCELLHFLGTEGTVDVDVSRTPVGLHSAGED